MNAFNRALVGLLALLLIAAGAGIGIVAAGQQAALHWARQATQATAGQILALLANPMSRWELLFAAVLVAVLGLLLLIYELRPASRDQAVVLSEDAAGDVSVVVD